MMNDPFGSMQGFMNQFSSFIGNPMSFMMQRKLNLPQGFEKNPQAAIQQLMNEGKLSQAGLNQLQQMASQIQNNPMFRQKLRK